MRVGWVADPGVQVGAAVKGAAVEKAVVLAPVVSSGEPFPPFAR
jgi:hypothetical protein